MHKKSTVISLKEKSFYEVYSEDGGLYVDGKQVRILELLQQGVGMQADCKDELGPKKLVELVFQNHAQKLIDSPINGYVVRAMQRNDTNEPVFERDDWALTQARYIVGLQLCRWEYVDDEGRAV